MRKFGAINNNNNNGNNQQLMVNKNNCNTDYKYCISSFDQILLLINS